MKLKVETNDRIFAGGGYKNRNNFMEGGQM